MRHRLLLGNWICGGEGFIKGRHGRKEAHKAQEGKGEKAVPG
jgi:hypothetical protein